jgi:hypothetical protein
MGMTDAFVDAERIAAALDDWLSGRRSFDDAMGDYQRTRDEQAVAMYDMTSEFAALAPPPPELQTLLVATAADEEATRDFLSVQAGTLPVPEFFDPDNVERIVARAG